MSAGFTLRKVGGLGMSRGKLPLALEMAACTSWAAASKLRFKANCRVIWLTPKALVEFMESRPAMVENSRSRGVATAEAMFSGVAPGKEALTRMVGKSTLGRRLAKHLNLQFIDMDHYIEERNYKTIPRIFAEEGEKEFRKKERKALEELSEFTNLVIATGGGAPCFFDNMDLMNNTGTTIYLNINPDILADRLMTSKTERPLIKGKSRKELVAFIDKTLSERNIFYKQAIHQITKPDIDLDVVKEMII